jgi:cation diffusion facilitator CzcD-associated flavoprotein CzcO
MSRHHCDALIVGAGFGGIYQLHKLLSLGLSVRVIDVAGDVGGTWYWNRYPGAMSDTESFVYRYSWDTDDLQSYPWSHHYVKQPDVLRYLEHVVEKHGFRKYMQFNTEMVGADWDDEAGVWRVEVGNGDVFVVKYLITALGLLSKANYPDIPGIDQFQGEMCHTAKWRPELDLANKRVGVIGCGSTGVQVITDIASKVKTLTSFQRHPQYSVPSGDGPVSAEYREHVNQNYPEIMKQVRNSICGFGFVESTTPFHSYPEEQREQIFEQLWQKGNGFRFMFGGFSDISTDREANEAACAFIRKKIAQTVKDPEKAKKLMPRDLYARRPLCDGGYYEQFNRDNVDIVDLNRTAITRITPTGIETEDGTVREMDVIIFATGFDAIDGNYNRVRIRGRAGKTLKQHWEPAGPTSYLGVFVPGFPNLCMITGPQGPFSNIPPAIELHVELISSMIERAEQSRRVARIPGQDVIEALPEAEEDWIQQCERAAEGSLFKETASWIFGNVSSPLPFYVVAPPSKPASLPLW